MASTLNVFNDQLTQGREFVEQQTNVDAITSAASLVIPTDSYGNVHVTALAVALQFDTTGTQTNDMQQLVIRVKDAGVAKALTWTSAFEAVGAALPSTTVAGKRHTLLFVYDSSTLKWGLVYAAVEA